MGHGVDGVWGLACPEEGRDRGVVAGPQFQLGGLACCLLGRGYRRGGLFLWSACAVLHRGIREWRYELVSEAIGGRFRRS